MLLGSAAIVVISAGIRAASDLLASIFLALVLTVAVTPLLSWARRHGWPTWAATLLTVVAAYAIVLFLVLAVAVSVVKLAGLVPQYADRADDLATSAERALADLGLPTGGTTPALDQFDVGKLVNLLTGLMVGVLGVLGNLFFLATLLFFLCAEATGFGGRMAVLRRDKPELTASLARYAAGVRRYLVVSAVFGGIVAVLDTAALWVLGIPLPLLWGLLSFVTNFVPNVGFVLGVIPPAILALLDQGWGGLLAVLIVYSTLNVVIQTFIQPRYVGESVGLSTLAAFLSLAVWTFLLGPLGALLAVPMTLLVRALVIDLDPRLRWTAALISSAPAK